MKLDVLKKRQPSGFYEGLLSGLQGRELQVETRDSFGIVQVPDIRKNRFQLQLEVQVNAIDGLDIVQTCTNTGPNASNMDKGLIQIGQSLCHVVVKPCPIRRARRGPGQGIGNAFYGGKQITVL